MKVAHTSTTSTDDSSSELPRRIPGASLPLGPRPAPPRQQLTASMAPLLRDIDWNGHMAADSGDWDNRPAIPTVPGQRRSPEAPQPKVPGQRDGAYDAAVHGYGDNWGRPSAWDAFGDGAA